MLRGQVVRIFFSCTECHYSGGVSQSIWFTSAYPSYELHSQIVKDIGTWH